MANKIIKNLSFLRCATLLTIVVLTLLTAGCKKRDWLDWKAMNSEWLAANSTRPYVYNDSTYQVRTTSTGLQYVILSCPNSSEAKPGPASTVTFDYQGWLINGYRFDHGSTTAALASLVPGFQEGLKLIRTHGDIVIFVPYSLGYGTEGSGSEGGTRFIPPYSTLIFEIHLKGVE